MSDLHIAIFSRAPVPGAAKTRLIPLLGEEGAAGAQRRMAWRTLETARAVPDASVSLWCAGDIGHPFLRACASHFNVPCLPQADGDLGLRMAHCLQAVLATHRKALLIGTDCPAFNVGALQAAAAALDAARMVFTPAEDGGYVLVGARRGGLAPRCFDDVAWSTAQVMAQTRQRLREAGWQSGQDWLEMPALWDVDTPADYLRARPLLESGDKAAGPAPPARYLR
ncbi:TIGR04282 family arsenosugar biosynthesis glycosyltransferase|uniref:TIGR04282 family arsenosugar biosynthesis glycosyltransferase n=1 Tax=Noviherbaspirillum sp. L7-7A TaxID=2850560 RepID=UPI001C2C6852|nr:TIGR04282 family arsenosugar biosynthesis glycosyltransferase [Noviherbaspirillum sp. L7-7A]MBV0878190.1 TIGR04282 family arsenosugar biosynthesis glycosyltransferase [Noviherbaspirillum sp. L7-7A]